LLLGHFHKSTFLVVEWGSALDTGFEDINQLIQARHLCEASRRLAALKAANHRVWGLDQRLAKVQQSLSTAQALFKQAEAALSQGQASKAKELLKQAHARAADLPDIEVRLEQTRQQISSAKAAAATALACFNEDDVEAAWQHVQEAMQLDRGAGNIEALSQQISARYEQHVIRRHGDRRARNISLVAVTVLVVVLGLGAMGLIRWAESSSAQSKALNQARSLRDEGYELIAAEKFAEARKSLQAAKAVLTDLDGADDSLHDEVDIALASNAIVQGCAGLVPLEDRWITPAQRHETLQARAGLHAEIQTLKATIEQFRDGRVDGIPPATDPAHHAALTAIILRTRDAADLILTDPSAAGQAIKALHRDFEQTLLAHGLEKYDGQWMPQVQAFARQQQAKGLVLHEGQWVTPEQKLTQEMMDKGMVKDGEEWVTPSELARRVFVKNEAAKQEESAKAQAMAEEAQRTARQELRDVARQYGDFVAEARKIRSHFAVGVTFNIYSDRLAQLIDVHAVIDDKTSTLRSKADALLTACRAVRSEWERGVRGERNDGAVASRMTQATELIDVFLIIHEQASRN